MTRRRGKVGQAIPDQMQRTPLYQSGKWFTTREMAHIHFAGDSDMGAITNGIATLRGKGLMETNDNGQHRYIKPVGNIRLRTQYFDWEPGYFLHAGEWLR